MSSPGDLIGKKAPTFTLPDSSGESFTFTAGESGLPTAILFYPNSGAFEGARVATYGEALLLTSTRVIRMHSAALSVPGVCHRSVALTQL